MTEFTAQSKCYDNTRLSDYKSCPRKYFLRHQLHWKPSGTAIALVFGLSWHEGMDVGWKNAKTMPLEDLVEGSMLAFYNKWEESGLDPTPTLDVLDRWAPRTPGTAHEMYWEYYQQRAQMMKSATLLQAEQPFAVPFPGLENTYYVGRMDKVIDYNAQTLVLEHKTTTAYATIGNFRSDYVDSWYSSPQVKGYQFGGGLYFPGLDGVWVDAALVHKKIHDAFKFIPVAHKFDLLDEWINDTKGWVERVQRDEAAYAAEGLKPGTFIKNEDNCFGKYGTCPYLNICRACADPTKLDNVPPGFEVEKWEPFSVLGLDKLVNNGDKV